MRFEIPMIQQLSVRSLAFWVSAATLFLTVAMAVVRPASSQWDFVAYYDAGLSARFGFNPYDYKELEQLNIRHSPMQFNYLPLLAYAFVPFTYVPLDLASSVWILLKGLALLFLFRLITKEFLPISPSKGWYLAFCVFAYNSTLLW